MTELDKMKQARKMFGNDVIIVHKMDWLGYYTMSSVFTPGRVSDILEDLVERMDMKS